MGHTTATLSKSLAYSGVGNRRRTGLKMKIVVEVFGRGIDVDVSVGRGLFSLALGRHLDVLLEDDGTRGRRWFDWLSHDRGLFEVWLGRCHGTVGLGPVLAWLAPKPGIERAIPAAA